MLERSRTLPWIASLLGAALALFAVAARPARAAVDSALALVTDERLAAGVPLGGIGTGKVELLTDGTFGNLTTQNNPDRPLPEVPGSFFALRVRPLPASAGEGGAERPAVARVLALRSAYDFPTVRSVRYRGLFPRAELRFSDPSLPVEATLRAHAVLIPHNLKDSSLPAAFFRFTLTNPGSERVEAALAFSWENAIGRGGNARETWSDRTGNVQNARREEGRVGVIFSGGQRPEGARKSSAGEYALLADAEDGRVAVLPYWNAGGDGRDFWTAFTRPVLFTGGPPPRAGQEGSVHPAAAVAVVATLPPGGSEEIGFVLAWRFPTRTAPDGTEYPNAYADLWPSAWDAASYAARYRETLLSGTQEWQDLLVRSTLPAWLKHRLLNDLFPLAASTVRTRAGLYGMLEHPTGSLGAVDSSLLTREFVERLFPELAARELQELTAIVSEEGGVPRSLGSPTTGFGAAPGRAPDPGGPDSACCYVLAIWRQFRRTGDPEPAKAAYPAVLRALTWLRNRDTDGDGLPEGPSFWDAQTGRSVPGSFSYTAGLYLAALRAGEALARLNGDRKTEELCRERFREARSTALAQLWNGRYFIKFLDPASGARSTNVFAGALAGEWAAESLGLGPLFDPKIGDPAIRHTLELLSGAYAGARPEGPGGPARAAAPNEARPDGSAEPGLSDVAWPGPLATFVGALAIARGQADAGLDLVRRLHELQCAGAQSLWDASLGYDLRTGDRVGPHWHAAALASWNVLTALEGVSADETTGALAVKPSLPGAWPGLQAPIFTPRYWAWMDFSRNPNNAAMHLRLRLLKKLDDRPISLARLEMPTPPGARAEDLVVLVTTPEGRPEGRAEVGPSGAAFVFKLPVEWRLGETIEMTIVPPEANQILLAFDPQRVLSYGASVVARDVSRERGIRFTLVNPTRERQVVNVRFRNTPDRTYEVYQNGRLLQRFTPDTPNERLTVVVPASPIAVERVEALRRTHAALERAREQARRDGREAALAPHLNGWLEKLTHALRADETARSAQIVMNPFGTRLFRTRREPPPLVPVTDPEPAVVAAEQALAEAPAVVAREIADPNDRRLIMEALIPIRAELAAFGEPQPGGSVRLTAAFANESRVPVRVALGLRLPQGWEVAGGRRELALGPGERGAAELQLRLPASLAPRRYPIEARATVAAEGVSWELPLRTRVGHAYIRDWSVIGAWPAGEEGIGTPLPPDTELEFGRDYGGRRWRPLPAARDRVDLAALFREPARGIAYAVTQVFSPTEREAVLELGADGAVLVRLNGDVILRRPTERAADAGPERIPIRLRQGWNTLVLKVQRLGAAWGFTAELTDPDGESLPGLRYSAAPAF